jgi:hypothetical protein
VTREKDTILPVSGEEDFELPTFTKDNHELSISFYRGNLFLESLISIKFLLSCHETLGNPLISLKMSLMGSSCLLM